MVIRSKTINLFQSDDLTDIQIENTKLNQKEMKGNKTILKSYPQRLVLELTNVCNLKCIMCGRDDMEFKPTVFDIENLYKLEHILTRIEEVTLFGWGEPTMYPKFKEILEYLNKFPVRKYFVTNGMRFDKIKDYLFNYKVDIMAVSVDGATSGTNNKIRCGSDFNFILKNLKEIVNDRNKKSLKYPYINFVMTMMDSNIEELPKLVEIASDIGIEEVKGVYLTVFSDNLINESLYNKQGRIKDIFNKAEDIASRLNIKLKLPFIQGDDIGGDKYHKDCFTSYRDFFIGSDGYVRPCQSTPIKLFKFNDYNSFEDMWNSKELQEYRKKVNNPDTMDIECRRCYQSSHANWNKEEAFLQVNNKFAPTWEK